MLKIFITLLLINISIFSQTQYLIKLTNPIQIDNKTLEFDINIKNTSSDFKLTSYQCAFSFDLNLGNTDSIFFKYLPNTSELANGPVYVLGHDTTDGSNKLIFVSGIGNDLISGDERLIGRFQIKCTEDFTIDLLNLKWNFSGSVNTILTDSNFTDITNPSSFINFDNSVTSVSEIKNIANNYTLSQNYPNPFNPSTKIKYSVPNFSGNIKSSKVILKIYDVLGRELTTLVNERKQPGDYEVEFNGTQYASGVYFYSLQAGRFNITKKMSLVK